MARTKSRPKSGVMKPRSKTEAMVTIPKREYDALVKAAGVSPQTVGQSGMRPVVSAPKKTAAALSHKTARATADPEAAEGAGMRRVIARYKRAVARGEEVQLPLAVWDALDEAGASPVRVLRKHYGLTQAALADAAGLSQSYVADIERGARTGTLPNLKALAAALQVPLDVLAGGAG